MASVTVTLTNICPGGNHLTFDVSGAVSGTGNLLLADLTDALTPDDVRTFIECIARLAKAGRTNAQAAAILQAGVTVTV